MTFQVWSQRKCSAIPEDQEQLLQQSGPIYFVMSSTKVTAGNTKIPRDSSGSAVKSRGKTSQDVNQTDKSYSFILAEDQFKLDAFRIKYSLPKMIVSMSVDTSINFEKRNLPLVQQKALKSSSSSFTDLPIKPKSRFKLNLDDEEIFKEVSNGLPPVECSTWDLKKKATNILAGRGQRGTIRIPMEYKSEKKMMELQGPIDWASKGLRDKYRGEVQREEVWRAWKLASDYAIQLFDGDVEAIPITRILRHPLYSQYFIQVANECALCSTKSCARVLMKRFVMDVHEVWLTNLSHLEEFKPQYNMQKNGPETDNSTAECIGSGSESVRNQLDPSSSKMGSPKGRRDTNAILNLSSQIQSVSQEYLSRRSYRTRSNLAYRAAARERDDGDIFYHYNPTHQNTESASKPAAINTPLQSEILMKYVRVNCRDNAQHEDDSSSMSDIEGTRSDPQSAIPTPNPTPIIGPTRPPHRTAASVLLSIHRVLPQSRHHMSPSLSLSPSSSPPSSSPLQSLLPKPISQSSLPSSFSPSSASSTSARPTTEDCDIMWYITAYDTHGMIEASLALKEKDVVQSLTLQRASQQAVTDGQFEVTPTSTSTSTSSLYLDNIQALQLAKELFPFISVAAKMVKNGRNLTQDPCSEKSKMQDPQVLELKVQDPWEGVCGVVESLELSICVGSTVLSSSACDVMHNSGDSDLVGTSASLSLSASGRLSDLVRHSQLSREELVPGVCDVPKGKLWTSNSHTSTSTSIVVSHQEVVLKSDNVVPNTSLHSTVKRIGEDESKVAAVFTRVANKLENRIRKEDVGTMRYIQLKVCIVFAIDAAEIFVCSLYSPEESTRSAFLYGQGPEKWIPEGIEDINPVSTTTYPSKMLNEHLISPLQERLALLTTIFNDCPTNFHPKELSTTSNHWEDRGPHGFRTKTNINLLDPDPYLPTVVFGIGKSVALPNTTSINPRNIWHATEPITGKINR